MYKRPDPPRSRPMPVIPQRQPSPPPGTFPLPAGIQKRLDNTLMGLAVPARHSCFCDGQHVPSGVAWKRAKAARTFDSGAFLSIPLLLPTCLPAYLPPRFGLPHPILSFQLPGNRVPC